MSFRLHNARAILFRVKEALEPVDGLILDDTPHKLRKDQLMELSITKGESKLEIQCYDEDLVFEYDGNLSENRELRILIADAKYDEVRDFFSKL